MELHVRGWHGLIGLVLVQWARQYLCIAVKFPSDLPLSVALGRTLVLEAKIDKGPGDTVTVMWRRELDGNISRIRDSQNETLTLTNFNKTDYGEYTITVLDVKSGKEEYASRIVRECEVPPRVSIALHCEVSSDSVQWDRPKFMWLANGVKLLNTTANLSSDGSKLYPSGDCVHNYTCIVDSSLGTSSTHYLNTGCGTNTDDQTKNGGCTLPWVLAGLLLAVVVAACIWCIWKRCSKKTTNSPAQPSTPVPESLPLTERTPASASEAEDEL